MLGGIANERDKIGTLKLTAPEIRNLYKQTLNSFNQPMKFMKLERAEMEGS